MNFFLDAIVILIPSLFPCSFRGIATNHEAKGARQYHNKKDNGYELEHAFLPYAAV
jgi:hypothetical protein